MDKSEKGKEGEALAEHYLRRQRYRIIEKNYSWPGGEIDIIAVKKKEIVFCEVKNRNTPRFGSGAEAVDRFKQKKIILTAKKYLAACEEFRDFSVRFDVIEVFQGDLRHIKGAFTDE